MLLIMKHYSPYQYAFLRILLGLHIFLYFSRHLVNGLQIFTLALAALSLFFTLGVWRRILALPLCIGWLALHSNHSLIASIGSLFIAWLLLASALIPRGETLTIKSEVNEAWQMPAALFVGSWAVLAIGYLVFLIAHFLQRENVSTIHLSGFVISAILLHVFSFNGRWLPARKKNAIVFFDGVCGLCDRFVDFSLAEDREQVLRFSPLQGSTAKQFEEKIRATNSDSVILIDDTGTYDRSDAVLHICAQLGNIWRLAIVFFIVPRPIRDWAYDLVAKNRYDIFGKRETCRLPTPEERGRILP